MDDADAERTRLRLVDRLEGHAVQGNAAIEARIDAADELAERGLAGPVLAEQRVDLARKDVEADTLQRHDTGKGLAEIDDLETRHDVRGRLGPLRFGQHHTPALSLPSPRRGNVPAGS